MCSDNLEKNEDKKTQSNVISEINEKIAVPHENVKSDKGYEIITEAMVNKIMEIFGKNSLLSMLYQVGVGPGQQIAQRFNEKYNMPDISILKAFELLMQEVKEFYSIKIREIEETKDYVRIVFENHCFLRKPIKNRETLDFGKSFCRVNKGYYETAFKYILGNKVKKIVMKFIENDPVNDVCVEEITFELNPS